MGGRERKFFSCSVNHIYQDTINGANIFYSLEDYLVYFTIFYNTMAKYCVTVLGLCLMYDHIHALLSAPEHDTLRQSVGETTSSRCPFSEKRRCRDLSAVMLRARREVKNTFSSSQHTNYVLLKRLMATLNTKEKEMLADYIISLYSGLDVKTLTSFTEAATAGC